MPTVKLRFPELIAALTKVIGSKPYAPIKLMYRTDHGKLLEEMKGNIRPNAGSFFYRGLIDIARFAYERVSTPPPVVKPPDPVVPRMTAPQTINPEGGSDARYCVRDLPYDVNRGVYYEPSDPAIVYDDNGLCKGGRTNDRIVPGLRGARSVDGADYCGYDYNGVSYPPWPAASYLK